MQSNPYEPPKSLNELNQHNSGQLIRKGKKQLFIPKGMDLPPRCVKCNAPARQPIKQRTLYWHSPILYVLILFNIIIYAIVAMFVRKKYKLSIGLCDYHQQKRRRYLFFTTLSIFLSFALLMISLYIESLSPMLPIFFGLVLLSIFAIIVFSQLLSATKINNDGITVRGCGAEFLQSFD